MNRLQRYKAEKAASLENASIFARLRAFGLAKLLGLMLALAIGFGLASVHLIPLAVRAGLPPPTAELLPYFAFASGALIGLSAALSRVVMDALQIGLAIPLALFALVGCVLSVVLNLVWTIALLDTIPVIGALTVMFALLVFGLSYLFNALAPQRGTSVKL